MSRAPRRTTQRARRKAATGSRFNPAEFFENTGNGRIISSHSKRDVIFSQGDNADSVFYIKKGKVKVSVISKQGKEAVVALLGPDELSAKDV